MSYEHITSRKNSLISKITALEEKKKFRDESGLFVAEGSKLLEDAITCGIELDCVLISEGTELWFNLPQVRVVELPSQLFSSISTQKSPQGVIFTGKKPGKVENTVFKSILLDGVQDPGNVGTVIRTAAAFGADSVLLTGNSADPFSYKVIRSSMGGVFRIPVIQVEPEELYELIGKKKLLAAMPSKAAFQLTEVDWDKYIPVIGSEGQGISEKILSICNGSYIIPMPGGSESLNAAVAAAITLWESCGRQ